MPGANCQGGLPYDPNTQTCYYQAFGNHVWDNQFSNNGFFGHPTNGDIGLATTLHNPGNCFNANTDPAGLTTDPHQLAERALQPVRARERGRRGAAGGGGALRHPVAGARPDPTRRELPPAGPRSRPG